MSRGRFQQLIAGTVVFFKLHLPQKLHNKTSELHFRCFFLKTSFDSGFLVLTDILSYSSKNKHK